MYSFPFIHLLFNWWPLAKPDLLPWCTRTPLLHLFIYSTIPNLYTCKQFVGYFFPCFCYPLLTKKKSCLLLIHIIYENNKNNKQQYWSIEAKRLVQRGRQCFLFPVNENLPEAVIPPLPLFSLSCVDLLVNMIVNVKRDLTIGDMNLVNCNILFTD